MCHSPPHAASRTIREICSTSWSVIEAWFGRKIRSDGLGPPRETGLPATIHPERMQSEIAGRENSRFHALGDQCPDDAFALIRGIGEQAERNTATLLC